jgi:carbamoyl-phosphate synthase large subunit
MSPIHEVLIEESVIGWKEFELEVMRDVADNFVVICSIENIDPMGVHTGDSITVAPILTLSDKEYQRMRDAARRSSARLASRPADRTSVCGEPGERPDDRHRDEPRVSRSSALRRRPPDFRSRKLPPSSRSDITWTKFPTTSRASRRVVRTHDRLRGRQDSALEFRSSRRRIGR